MAGNRGEEFFSKRKTQKSLNEEDANEDRLSSLPDVLILHILSFLDTQEVVKTCVLSKRWKFIWTMVSELDLSDGEPFKSERFVDRVGRMLAMCSGFQLKRFAVNFRYLKRCASTVNFWVNLLVKNKVENITLTCYGASKYVLPQMFYLHSSMTNLHLRYCEIDPRGVVEWESLKHLEISSVKLTDCVMEKILSGCPVLEVLDLWAVSGLTCINISSPNLTTLKLESNEFHVDDEVKPIVEISAPHLRILSIKEDVTGLQYRLKNVMSLVCAEIDIDNENELYASPSMLSYIKELFSTLRSVKDLHLGPWCTEILSSLELEGWKVPPSTRVCLKLQAYWHLGIFPGILSILKSSPYLNKLVIKGRYHYFQDQVATYFQDSTLKLVMSHLKTIEIIGFTNEFLHSKVTLKLVKILLESSPVLESLTICIKPVDSTLPSDSALYKKLALQYYNVFPQASPKAIIIVIC